MREVTEMKKIKRREGSIPVQTRIYAVDLAKLLVALESRGQVRIKNMSELVKTGIELLVDKIEEKMELPMDLNRMDKAYNYLEAMGFIQRSLAKRSRGKVAAAMRFETMRDQGIDPRSYDERAYNSLHNKHSVRLSQDSNILDDEQEYQTIFDTPEFKKEEEEERKKELEALRKKTVEDAIKSGIVTEESDEEIEARRMPRWKKDENGKFIVPEGITSRAPEKLTDGELREFVPMRKLTEEELRAKEEEVIRRDKERIALENAPINEEDWPVVDE